MPSLDVLDLLVVLGVVRKVARRLVVGGERGGRGGTEAQLIEEAAEGYTPSLAASLTAMISASHDERATLVCFLLDHEIAAKL